MSVATLDRCRKSCSTPKNFDIWLLTNRRYWDEQAEQAEGPLESASILNGSATAGFGSTTLDENGCVTDGPYTNVRLTLDTELNRVEPVCLSRLFKQNQYEQTAQKIIDACLALDNYVDFNNCLGASPHTGGHYAIGGTVSDLPAHEFIRRLC